MQFLKNYSAFIEEAILENKFSKKPANLYDPLNYFMSLGGKRIRPMLTLMAAEMFGTTRRNALPAALAVEMFHNFSLIHDDLMDQAPLRRNQQTVHEKWNPTVAILSGDVLLIKAYQQLARQKENHLPFLLEVFNKTAVEVCEGQQMDVDFEQMDDVSIPEYIEMIRLKTSVLLGCALQMGAIVANATLFNQELIYKFGVDLGIAFQIQDDILDLYADQSTFGKQVGGDVMINKKTILYLLAQKNANPEQKQKLESLYLETDMERKVTEVRALFDEMNIKKLASDWMNEYTEKALLALNRIGVSESQKLELVNLSSYLMVRNV